MKTYKKKRITTQVLDKMTCDKCGIDISDPYIMPENHTFDNCGGYNSKFGDMNYYTLDLCDDCWYELVKDYIHYKDE